MDLYDLVENVKMSVRDVGVQFEEIPESDRENMTIEIFAELAGLEKEKAWREWVRGSDRVFGEQDVSLVYTLYQNCRKDIVKELETKQSIIQSNLSKEGASSIIAEKTDNSKMRGMLAPEIFGVKGNWMSTKYLFGEWYNPATTSFHRGVYGQWLMAIYKQLVEANRDMGDGRSKCEEWELKMHKTLTLGQTSMILKTKNGTNDITALAISFASMVIPSEGWVVTDRRLVMLSIFSEFAFRGTLDLDKDGDDVSIKDAKEDISKKGKGVKGKCYFCKKNLTKLFRCSRCMVACYCDKKCQKNHWKVHKSQCAILCGDIHPLGDLLK